MYFDEAKTSIRRDIRVRGQWKQTVSITSKVGQGTTGGGVRIDVGTNEEGVSSFVAISFTIFFSLGLRPFLIGASSSSSSSYVAILGWSLAASFSSPSSIGTKVLGHSRYQGLAWNS